MSFGCVADYARSKEFRRKRRAVHQECAINNDRRRCRKEQKIFCMKYSKNQKIVPSSTRKEGCRNAGLQGQGHPCRCIYLNRVASTRDHYKGWMVVKERGKKRWKEKKRKKKKHRLCVAYRFVCARNLLHIPVKVRQCIYQLWFRCCIFNCRPSLIYKILFSIHLKSGLN